MGALQENTAMHLFCVLGGNFGRTGRGDDQSPALPQCIDPRSPTAPSFVARRKMGEKGVARRRKLRIPRFGLWAKSSVAPLLLLSPPNPLRWALAGSPISASAPFVPTAVRALLNVVKPPHPHPKGTSYGRSRHEQGGISGAPLAIRIRARQLGEHVWNRFVKSCPY